MMLALFTKKTTNITTTEMPVWCYEFCTGASYLYIKAAQGTRTQCNDDVCCDRLTHIVVAGVGVAVVKIAVIVVMLCQLAMADK